MPIDKILILSISLIAISLSFVFIFASQNVLEKTSLDIWYSQHKSMLYGCKGTMLDMKYAQHGVFGCSGTSYSYMSYDDPRHSGLSVKLPTCQKGYNILFDDQNRTFSCYKPDTNVIYFTQGTSVITMVGGGGDGLVNKDAQRLRS